MNQIIVLALMVSLMVPLASAASDFGLEVTTDSPLQLIEGEPTTALIDVSGQGSDSYSQVSLELTIVGDAMFENGEKTMEIALGDLQADGGFLGLGSSSASAQEEIRLLADNPSKTRSSGKLKATISYTIEGVSNRQGPSEIAILDIVGVQSQAELTDCESELSVCAQELASCRASSSDKAGKLSECKRDLESCQVGDENNATGAVVTVELGTGQLALIILGLLFVGYMGYRGGKASVDNRDDLRRY